MKFFSVPFDVLVLRYYLLMAIVVGSSLIGLPILGILALPIFLSAMLGISFKSEKRSKSNQVNTTLKTFQIEPFTTTKKTA